MINTYFFLWLACLKTVFVDILQVTKPLGERRYAMQLWSGERKQGMPKNPLEIEMTKRWFQK